ncbi:MAG TPA: PKD domain-containing protein [Flavobacteriales bacterium]
MRTLAFLTQALLLLAGRLSAQCPQLYDHAGLPSAAPTWYSCSGTNFNLVIATPQTVVGPYTINWGDGSPVHNGVGLAPPQTVQHNYPLAVAEYTVTFSTPTGCTVTGTVIMEQSTSASIQIPVGGLTQVCAPQSVDFINSSTNTSPNTTFIWDFGDDTALETYDHTNLGQTLTHLYEQGTVSCETIVRLTAYNECNTLQGGPSIATFNPIRVWDIDSANITPSATLLCWPDNEVTYTNTTDRNCLMQGNIYQRYEYWNFGDYWGLGHDSIIDWTPWPPTFPHTIAYPAIGTYEVMLQDSNYCGIDTTYITIQIVPPPQVTLSVDPDTVCAGEAVVFTPTMTGGANQHRWNFGQGAGWQVSGAGTQSRVYNTPGTYIVRYVASINGATPGCSDTASVTVTVLPSPTVDFTLDEDAACVSLTTDPTNNSVGGTVWTWDMGDGTTFNGFDPPPHTYTTIGDAIITLTVANPQGCTDHMWLPVHVYPIPVPDIGVQSVCLGEPASFTDLTVTPAGNPIQQWDWTFGDGGTANIQAPQHTYANAGNFNVQLTVTTPYCSGTSTEQITVEGLPTAGFTMDDDLGCSPFPVAFTNTSLGAVSYIWHFGDGATSNASDPTHTYLNFTGAAITDTVVLIASTAFGCTDTTEQLVTVHPPVNAAFTHDAVPGCAPLDVHFTNGSTGASSYLWNFGDGNTSTEAEPDHQYVNLSFVLQNYTVSLTATSPAGCSHTVQQTITVYPTPDFTFVAAPDSGCTPLNVTFPAVVGAVLYQWSFGDGSYGSGPSPLHTYVNNSDTVQDYPVTLIATNAFGCSDTTHGTVRVFPLPTAQIALDQVSGCHPLVANITNSSQGAVQYAWNYGDGNTSANADPVHSYTWYNYAGPAGVTFPIGMTATSQHGCTATATAQVQVFPQVQALFTLDTVGCSPFDANIVNSSTGAQSNLWIFGDGGGSTAVQPDHFFFNEGLDDVVFHPQLIVTSTFGCRDTLIRDIVVHPQPIAQFVPNPAIGCTPLAVELQDYTIGATGMAWDFGDGTGYNGAPGNVAHTFVNTTAGPIEVPVRLIATSPFGCLDTTIVAVDVYPPVVAAFDAPTEACSPFVLDLEATGAGGVQWLWDMGNGVMLVGEEVSYTYVNNGSTDLSYDIELVTTSAYGCSDTLVHTITVHPAPTAAFTATPFSQQYPNATVDLLNSTPTGPWSYAWNFGDGNTSADQNPIAHTYGTYGVYQIQLVVTAGVCADTVSQQVTIVPPMPVASFLGSGEGCVPLTVEFTNTSQYATSYIWNFGDGGTSSAEHPVHIYDTPGTYTVTLNAFGIGGTVSTAVKIDSVVVHPHANAYCVVQPNQVIAPAQPVFTFNLSGNADNYIWDFGDGTLSYETAPVHYYQQPGTYFVTLIANNIWNCPDTFAVVNGVVALAAGEIQFPNAFTPGNSGPTDGVYDPQSYDNDFFFPVYSGVESYKLQVFDRWGELLFETTDPKRGWDGYYRGKPAKQDVYVWKAYAKFTSGDEKRMSGDVTLLR